MKTPGEEQRTERAGRGRGGNLRRVVMLVRNPFTHDSRVENEARTLLAGGYSVTVVCEARPGLPRRENRDGIAIRRVPRRHRRIRLIRYFTYSRALRRALRAERPHILHAHDANALVDVGPVARQLSIPYVYDSHELWTHRTRHKHSRLYHRVSQAWHVRLERRWAAGAAAVLTVSQPIAYFLERQFGLRSVRLVPNYPTLESLDRRLDLRSLPGTESIPKGAPILLHIGAYLNDRGIEQVMQALTEVPDVHLVMLGAGDRAEQARREARALGVPARVHPLAEVPGGEVVPYASSATIGVVPIVGNALSYQWALPNKLFQSMAAGLPVIVSDLPEMAAVVRGADAGLIVDPQNPSAIAEAIRALIDDPDLMRRMGANGRDAVVRRYNWDFAARVLVEVYDGLGGATGNGATANA